MKVGYFYLEPGDFVDVTRVKPVPNERCRDCGRLRLGEVDWVEIVAGASLPLGFGSLEGVGLAVTQEFGAQLSSAAPGSIQLRPVVTEDRIDTPICRLVVEHSIKLHPSSFFPEPNCPICGSGGGLQERRMVLEPTDILPPLAYAGRSRFHLLLRSDVHAILEPIIQELGAWPTYWSGEELPSWTFEGQDLSEID